MYLNVSYNVIILSNFTTDIYFNKLYMFSNQILTYSKFFAILCYNWFKRR